MGAGEGAGGDGWGGADGAGRVSDRLHGQITQCPEVSDAPGIASMRRCV